MAATPSRLAIEENGSDRVLVLHGDVDSHTSDLLAVHLDALGKTADVTLDLSEVVFIDSSGLRVVISAHQEAVDAGIRLVLRSPSEAVGRLLEITGLKDHLFVE